MPGGPKSTRLQEAAIAALIASPSVEQAAEQIGVSATTMWRWLRDDQGFKEKYRLARQEVIGQAVAQLGAGCTDAAQSLRNIVNDSDAPASARVSAARVILEMAFRGVELENLAVRIEVLEQKLMQGGDINKQYA
ncbi:MAG: transposase family protein [Bacillota bacterium]